MRARSMPPRHNPTIPTFGMPSSVLPRSLSGLATRAGRTSRSTWPSTPPLSGIHPPALPTALGA
eukprot:13551326-Alexandrium_andersonii.AAC.1